MVPIQITSSKNLLISVDLNCSIVFAAGLYNSKKIKENNVPNQHQLINAAVVEDASIIFLMNTASMAVNIIAQILNCIAGFFKSVQENLSAVVSKTK